MSPETIQSPLLTARGLTVGYHLSGGRTRVVLSNIEIELNRGEVVCLVGANGAGKSTLLRTLAAMQHPLSGRVEVAGADIALLSPKERARVVSVVLTDRFDPGYITVFTLVSLGRNPYTNWAGSLAQEDRLQVDRSLAQVGIEELASRSLPQLSDGERQKAMIARALAQETPLIILDEPTAFLDVTARADIMQVLLDLSRQTGKTVILSTHDLEFALRSADRMMLIMPNGTLKTGAPEDLVLQGSFSEAFRSPNVEFDQNRAQFVLKRGMRGKLRVRGEGRALTWTVHALERIGYTISSDDSAAAPSDSASAPIDSAPPLVSVESAGDGYRWELAVRRSGGPVEHSVYDSIHALADAIRGFG